MNGFDESVCRLGWFLLTLWWWKSNTARTFFTFSKAKHSKNSLLPVLLWTEVRGRVSIPLTFSHFTRTNFSFKKNIRNCFTLECFVELSRSSSLGSMTKREQLYNPRKRDTQTHWRWCEKIIKKWYKKNFPASSSLSRFAHSISKSIVERKKMEIFEIFLKVHSLSRCSFE